MNKPDRVKPPPNLREDSSIRIRESLQTLYERYNRREYIAPDPLQFVWHYDHPRDREIVGLIASSLAFGNVVQIVRSIASVLGIMPFPFEFLRAATPRDVHCTFASFRHRFTDGRDLARLLLGIKKTVDTFGSLEACFAARLEPDHATVLPALATFAAELKAAAGTRHNYLMPSPEKGSACKRLNLFLRWMARRDAVDPGGWDAVSPSQLVIPLDTHMHRIALRLGFTCRKQANMRTALEVTEAFRRIVPEDPVRYDFALTRLGIRTDTDSEAFLRSCGG